MGRNTGMHKRNAKKADALANVLDRAKQRGMRDNLIKVRITKSSDMLGQGLHMCVEVFSTAKPGRAVRVERDMHRGDSINSMRALAKLLAAAGAEECCERFEDNYEPSEFERGGGDAFDQILEAMQAGVLTTGNTKV